MTHEGYQSALDQTIHHTLYQETRGQLIEAINIANNLGGSIVPFLGPTRCGKSRMLTDIREALGQPTKEVEGWLYDSDFVLGTIPNKPNSKMLVQSMLAALGLNGRRTQSAAEIEQQLYKEIVDKGIKVIAMDECNHCAERGHHMSKRGATDHFKRLVDNTGVTLILCGLPKFQTILDENEQCRDRSMNSVY
ncbi:MAG: TniB family NTP-binding protein, partial [Sneathiella sp.]